LANAQLHDHQSYAMARGSQGARKGPSRPCRVPTPPKAHSLGDGGWRATVARSRGHHQHPLLRHTIHQQISSVPAARIHSLAESHRLVLRQASDLMIAAKVCKSRVVIVVYYPTHLTLIYSVKNSHVGTAPGPLFPSRLPKNLTVHRNVQYKLPPSRLNPWGYRAL
jgi:hypothetical protein